jgi:TPR repeat protein
MQIKMDPEIINIQLEIQLNNDQNHIECFKKTLELSKKHKYAKVLLGYMYLKGIGTKKDVSKANNIFFEHEDITFAQTCLGIMYLEGLGVPKDVSKAKEIFYDSCEVFEPFALTRLGNLFQDDNNMEAARLYFEKAAKLNHVEAMVALAKLYSEFDLEKAMDMNKKLMDMGSSDGYYGLATLQAFYYDASQDHDQSQLKEILFLFEEASRMGNEKANFTLGTLYSDQSMVPQDIPRSIEFFEKAIVKGSSDAMISLGEIYEDQGDVEKAITMWTRAFALNNPKSYNLLGDVLFSQGKLGYAKRLYKMGRKRQFLDSYLNLARIYLKEERSDKAIATLKESIDLEPNFVDASFMLGEIHEDMGDTDDAIAWYRHGFDLDHVASIMELARILSESDINKTIEYLEKGVKLGDSSSILELARIYEEGDRIDADPKKAFELYLMAHEKGEKIATVKIGYLYENGIGVKQDYKKALKFYQQSDEAIAKNNLGEFYLKGFGVKQNIAKAQECFESAISMGEDSGWALQNLCILLMIHGGIQGTARSVKLSKKLWTIIEDQMRSDDDNSDTLFLMARCYLFGLGVDIDYDQAQTLLESITYDSVPEAKLYLEEYFSK